MVTALQPGQRVRVHLDARRQRGSRYGTVIEIVTSAPYSTSVHVSLDDEGGRTRWFDPKHIFANEFGISGHLVRAPRSDKARHLPGWVSP